MLCCTFLFKFLGSVQTDLLTTALAIIAMNRYTIHFGIANAKSSV